MIAQTPLFSSDRLLVPGLWQSHLGRECFILTARRRLLARVYGVSGAALRAAPLTPHRCSTFAFQRKGLTSPGQSCYTSSMHTKDEPDGRPRPTFTEAARRAQLIECAIETIAMLGYAQASLAHIAERAGISKSMITYYFSSKEELLEQVVTEIYAAAVQAVTPQIAAQPTAQLRLQAYIRSAVDYIGAHRMRMVALLEITRNFRTPDGKLRYGGSTEEWILTALEALLRQ